MRALVLAVFLVAFAESRAQANFHLWDIQEVYTNSDGSIQFIEFFTTFGGQEVLAGHTLSSTGATTLSFPSNLSLNSPLAGHPNTKSSTANQTFLVATANFESLFGIVPDYIIPAGFLQSGAGNVLNFQTGTDAVNLTGLPTGGIQSLNADITSSSPTAFSFNSTATPKNFRGETAVIPEPRTASFCLGVCVFFLVRRRIRQSY